MSSSADCPATSSLHPLITQNLVETSRYYCPFLDRGFCRDKSKCNFSHERNNSIKVPLDYCHFYLANRCLYGLECKFQHIVPHASDSPSGVPGSTSSNIHTNITSNNPERHLSNFPTSSNKIHGFYSNADIATTSKTSEDNSRKQNSDNPPQNFEFQPDDKDNYANNDRSQPPQFAHHSQYWYHPTQTSATNTCPFLNGDDPTIYYDANRLANQGSQIHDVRRELESTDEHIIDYMQMQTQFPYHHDYLPLRSCSSLPSLINYEDYCDPNANISEEKQHQQIGDSNFNPWNPPAYCRRHSIGQINMISDEHLLLSCDLCGRRCLEPSNSEQQRLHRDECLRELEQEMELSFAIQRSKDKVCGICMDVVVEKKPVTSSRFGILEKCNHIFCLDCIRKWRGTKQFENRTIRACPECRTCSDFVVPSKYWVEEKDDKEKLIHDYKANLKSKACKYFDEGRGECPFAGACFYKHAYPDGRIAKFDKPKPSRRFNSRRISLAAARLIVLNMIRPVDDDDEDDEDEDDDDLNIITDEDEDDDEDEDIVGEHYFDVDFHDFFYRSRYRDWINDDDDDDM